jgi:hypothetical protein
MAMKVSIEGFRVREDIPKGAVVALIGGEVVVIEGSEVKVKPKAKPKRYTGGKAENLATVKMKRLVLTSLAKWDIPVSAKELASVTEGIDYDEDSGFRFAFAKLERAGLLRKHTIEPLERRESDGGSRYRYSLTEKGWDVVRSFEDKENG